jgi:hypothetical protein
VLEVKVSISPTFYWRNCANILAQIKSLTFTASTKKLRAKLSYEKGARKMLLNFLLAQGNWRNCAHTMLVKLIPIVVALEAKKSFHL